MGVEESIEALSKRMDVVERKINAVASMAKEIRDMMVMFLDAQSKRNNFAGRDMSQNKNTDDDKKKFTIYSIDVVPEDERPPHWNVVVNVNKDTKKNLWTLLQTPNGRELLNKILRSQSDDPKVLSLKTKIKEFYAEAKNVYKRLKEQGEE